MNRSFLFCLLALCFFQLPACTIYGGTSGTTSKPRVETKGQQFSRCLNTETPEECDRRINGANINQPQSGGGGY